jgi:hypothetical protein
MGLAGLIDELSGPQSIGSLFFFVIYEQRRTFLISSHGEVEADGLLVSINNFYQLKK